MKNGKWLLLAGMVIVLMTIGCQKQMGFVDSPQGGDVGIAATSTLPIQYNPGGSWFTYFMWTPPGPTAYPLSIGNDSGYNGSVTLQKVGTNLVVTFETFGDWYIQLTHVDVALTKDGLHHNKAGNLVPGQFLFQGPAQSIPYPQVVTMTIPWDPSWNTPPPEGLYIAALANVCEGEYVDGQWHYWNFNTAAGGGPPRQPYKTLKLPTYPVEMCRIATPFVDSNTYWQIGLDSIKEDSGTWSVWNGDNWKGWCMEITRDLEGCHMVTLKDSRTITPADGPRVYKNGEWDRVNWLLNHKSLFPLPIYTYALYEDVIRYLLNDLTPPPSDYWELQMYNAAVSNGDGYLVPVGGWVAVVCVYPTADEEHQMVFIEVDP